MAKLPLRKIKPLAFFLLILASAFIIGFTFLPEAKAETKIISLTPEKGIVGTLVQLRANISTPNGTYQIWFDDIPPPLSGNASKNNVTASFTIPHVPEGIHNVTIVDLGSGENNTKTFTVLTHYSFEPAVPPSPAQLQQGANVIVSINATGGKSNHTYPLLKVKTPKNQTYEASKNITTNLNGDFYGNLTYISDFSNGANTNFTGEYKILFNETIVNRFFIGITNSSEYHRRDLVSIRAVDYPLNQNATITIKFGDKIIDSVTLNATEGIININWPVPSDVLIGDYNLSITPVPRSKQNASDVQIFKIPGFETKIFTRNLANETIPSVFVRTYDESAKTFYNKTSSLEGLANFNLERGNYSCEAFFKKVNVGEINFTIINKNEQLNFTCLLSSLNINVVDAQDFSVRIPFVSISLTYNYTTNLDVKENKTETKLGVTNITGTWQLQSLLTNITYIMNASRYGKVFNENNNTIYNLPKGAYRGVTILCPTRRLQVTVIDANNQPIADVAVRSQELMGGLSYSKVTDSTGTAVSNCTFGRYLVKIYKGETLLNETTVDLFQDKNLTVMCKLYGLDFSIKLVDYFGQPISNAKVVLQRDGLQDSSLTKSDGMITFSNIIGGNLLVTVYLPGQSQPYVAETYYVDNSITTIIRIEKYMMLAGFMVEISQLITAIILVVTVIVILSVEVYRRKHVKPQKTSS